MSKGLFFWIVFIVSILFSGFAIEPRTWRTLGPWAVIYILVGVLGWATFGAAVQ
jgi:hypothetical protein